jgi:phage gp29-like protein
MAVTKPVKEELARRDEGLGAVSGYASLLATDDSVLNSRGRDYRIYRETLRDDQAGSTFAQRRLAVVSKEWHVEPASKRRVDVAAADFMREQLQVLEWDRITDRMLFARWYGHAVAECMWQTDGRFITLADVRVRDRSRFAYDRDRALYLVDGGKTVPMPERKFWTISTGEDNDDAPYGLGLAHWAYWPVFFKRNGIKFWLTFAEKFGMPTAVGKVPAGQLDDVQFRTKALQALQAIASETAVLVPAGMEIDLLEASRSGTGTYDQLVAAMDAAIAKVVVGQTASSEGTPGRLGNDKLQGEVRMDLVKADADLVCGSFNRSPAAWLTEWNFPGARAPRVWRVVEPAEDLNARAERDSKVFALGYEPTEEYIRETYGEGWQKKAAQAGVDPAQVPGQLAAEFAELGALSAMKLGHRGDQAAIAEAAQAFANRYESVLGERVQELLDLAETTGDYGTFQERIKAMMAEPAKADTTNALRNAGVFSRLLGLFRQQRNDRTKAEAVAFAEARAEREAKRDGWLAALLFREPKAPTITVNPAPVTVHVDASRGGGTVVQTFERDAEGNVSRITTSED